MCYLALEMGTLAPLECLPKLLHSWSPFLLHQLEATLHCIILCLECTNAYESDCVALSTFLLLVNGGLSGNSINLALKTAWICPLDCNFSPVACNSNLYTWRLLMTLKVLNSPSGQLPQQLSCSDLFCLFIQQESPNRIVCHRTSVYA